MSVEKLFGSFYEEDNGKSKNPPVQKKAMKTVDQVPKEKKRGVLGFLLKLRPSYWLRRARLEKKLYYYTVIGLILLVGGGIVAFQMIFPHKGEAAWFNQNWLYRKAINITSHTSAENYVYIELSGSNAIDSSDSTRFQGDCGDLRFTDVSGNLLPYYIVSGCGTSSTVVDINLKTFPAGAQTFYYYYGNPSAANGFSLQGFPKAATNYTIGSIGSEENGPGPVAYWKLDDGSGTVASSSASFSYPLQLTGSTLPAWTSSQCMVNECLFFNGQSSSAFLSGTIPGVKTISFWVSPSASAAAEILSLNNLVDIRTNSVGSVSASWVTSPTIYVNGMANSNSGQVATVSANTWNYITITTNTAISASAIKLGKGPLGVLKGFMDEVKFYNYVRTPAQIQTDMAARGGKSGTSSVLGAQDQSFLSNGLIGYWKMDETAANQCSGGANDSCDSSGNGLDGLWNGDATASNAAKFASGVTFDGTGDYVQVTQTPLLKPTTALTVSAWVKASSTGATNERILSYSSSQNIGYSLIVVSGKVQWSVAVNGTLTENTTGTTAINDNSWHHVVGTWDGLLLREYIDGKLEATKVTPTGTISYGNVDFIIGANNNGAANPFTGVIDDVRVYKRALSGIEAENLYNFAPGPAGYWPFEEKQGVTTVDQSGNGNNGTLINAPPWVRGKIGSGLSFDGTRTGAASATYVDLGDLAFLERSQFTVGAWVYRTGDCGTFTTCSVFTKGTSGNSGYSFDISSLSCGAYKVRLNLKDLQSACSNTVIQLNTWYYIAASVDNDNIKLYINGILDTTVTRTQTLAYGTETGKIGNANSGNDLGFSGLIDEVRFYNYVRSIKQIAQDMNAGHPGVGNSMPIGYWKFDAGYGNIASNSGGLQGSLDAGMHNFANPASVTSGWTNNGKFGKALLFDGTNDYVNAGSRIELNAQQFSISAWFNPFSLAASAYTSNPIVSKYADAGSNRSYLIGIDPTSQDVWFQVSPSGASSNATELDSGVPVPIRTWSHVVVTFDNVKLRMYINGNLVASKSVTSSAANGVFLGAAPFLIGGRQGNLGQFTNFFNGIIDEVKYYNYTLSDSDARAEYNRGSSLVLGAFGMSSTGVASNSANAVYCVPGDTTQTCSPVGEWNFEEGQGNRVNDSTGGGANGLWAGTGQRWGIGRFGKGGIFNSADTSVNTGGAFDFTSGQSFSTAAWIKSSFLSPSGANTYSIVSKGCGFVGTYSLWYRSSTTNATAVFCLHDSGGTQVSATNLSGISLQDNKWHYLVGTRDVTADTINIYVDGVLQNSTNDTTTGNFARGNAVILGARGVDFAEHFQGTIDQAQIYNYALSPAQIAWNYNHGKPVVWYKMDECQGSTIHSSVGTSSASFSLGGAPVTSAGTCTTSSTVWGNGATGKFNSSIAVDGTDDYASSDVPSYLQGGSQMTLSAWVKVSSFNGHNASVALFGSSSDKGYWFDIDASGIAAFWVSDDGSNQYAAGTGTRSIVSVGQWSNLVGVYNGPNISLYVNGNLVGTGTTPGTALHWVTTANAFAIGRLGAVSSDYFNGQIDEVQKFNYAMTQTQIRNLYNQSAAVRFGPATGTP